MKSGEVQAISSGYKQREKLLEDCRSSTRVVEAAVTCVMLILGTVRDRVTGEHELCIGTSFTYKEQQCHLDVMLPAAVISEQVVQCFCEG